MLFMRLLKSIVKILPFLCFLSNKILEACKFNIEKIENFDQKTQGIIQEVKADGARSKIESPARLDFIYPYFVNPRVQPLPQDGPIIATYKRVISNLIYLWSSINGYGKANNKSFIDDIITQMIIYSRVYVQYAIFKLDDYKQPFYDVYSPDKEKMKKAIDAKHSFCNIYGYSDFVDYHLPYCYPTTNEYITGEYQMSIPEAYLKVQGFANLFVTYEEKHLKYNKYESFYAFNILDVDLFKAALTIVDRPIVYFANSGTQRRDTKLSCTINGKNDITQTGSYHSEIFKNTATAELESIESINKLRGHLNNSCQIEDTDGPLSMNLVINLSKQILTLWNCYFHELCKAKK